MGDDIDRMLEEQSQRSGRRGGGEDRRRRRRRSRSRSRSGGRSRGRRRVRRRSRSRDATDREVNRLQARYQREAERSQRTVFACQIHPKNEERDLFEFFSEAGRVIDIQLLRDSRTFRSKGLGYIEFEDRTSIPTALSFSGKSLGGYPIIVQLTQAEKNIAAQAAADVANAQLPLKIRVKNLPRKISEEDIHPVFSAFGDIMRISLHRSDDGETREGYVEFKKESEAIAALGQLNGLEILGKKMVCTCDEKGRDPSDILAKLSALDPSNIMGNPAATNGASEPTGLDDGEGGTAMTAERRAHIMQMLHGGQATAAAGDMAAAVKAEATKQLPISSCLLLRSMFDPTTETEADFDLDIREDVMEEVSKYGTLRHIYVDKVSKEGLVYLKFADSTGSKATFDALNGRWFGQNQIKAQYMVEADYTNMFPDI